MKTEQNRVGRDRIRMNSIFYSVIIHGIIWRMVTKEND